MSVEECFKTSVYTIQITLNQRKNPGHSDKVLLSALTSWIQKELESADKTLKERHGQDSGFDWAISYSETNKITL